MGQGPPPPCRTRGGRGSGQPRPRRHPRRRRHLPARRPHRRQERGRGPRRRPRQGRLPHRGPGLRHRRGPRRRARGAGHRGRAHDADHACLPPAGHPRGDGSPAALRPRSRPAAAAGPPGDHGGRRLGMRAGRHRAQRRRPGETRPRPAGRRRRLPRRTTAGDLLRRRARRRHPDRLHGLQLRRRRTRPLAAHGRRRLHADRPAHDVQPQRDRRSRRTRRPARPAPLRPGHRHRRRPAPRRPGPRRLDRRLPSPQRVRLVRLRPTDFYGRLRDRFRLTDAPANAQDGPSEPFFRPDTPVPADLAGMRLPPAGE